MTDQPGSGGDAQRDSPGHGSADAIAIDRTPGGQAIARLTRGLALIGGGLMLAAVAVTLVSVLGRYTIGMPVPGDYELIEIVCAVGVFLFFPYTHVVSGNITAEFFTAKLPARYKRVLDIINDVVFVGLAALLTWRLSHGLADKFASGEVTILIRIPFWWAYSFAVLSMALLTLVCAWRVVAGIGSLSR